MKAKEKKQTFFEKFASQIFAVQFCVTIVVFVVGLVIITQGNNKLFNELHTNIVEYREISAAKFMDIQKEISVIATRVATVEGKIDILTTEVKSNNRKEENRDK